MFASCSSLIPTTLSSNYHSRPNYNRPLNSNPVLCSYSPPSIPNSVTINRRSVTISILLFYCYNAVPNCTAGANPFDKYVKRKQLDPLESYVPAVLLSQAQFEDLEKALDVEQPRYDLSRSLLRSGPAASLRVNIRAVAQYATDDGNGKAATAAVDQCLRALEDLDALLLRATRKDPAASVGTMKSKISLAVGALDSLLQTVPSPVLDKGKAIADTYRNSSNEEEQSRPEDLDPSLKQLESIL